MRARVVLLSRDTKPPYRFLEVPIVKGRPIAPQDATAYYVRYPVNGKRRVEPFGGDLAKAFAAYLNHELNLARIEKGLKPIEHEASALIQDFKTQGAGITIKDAISAYLEKQKARVDNWRAGERSGLSKSTVATIDKAMRDFQTACDDCGATRVDEFKDAVRGRAILLHFKKWLREHTQRRDGLPAATDEKKFIYVANFSHCSA